MKKSYVAVMNIPSPYRLHSLNETWRQLQARGIDFHCHFMAKGHAERPKSWLNPKIDFPHTYWRDFGVWQYHFNPTLLLKLWREQPDYLFCSDPFDTFTGIGLMLGCRKSVRLAWSEGNTATPGKLSGIRGWVKRLVYAACQYIVVPGEEGVKYVALHQARTRKKMPPCVIHPNLVDESRFVPREGGTAGPLKCFIPARFVWDKGLEEFFSALEPEMLAGWKILILGHGPLQEKVEALIARRGMSGHVEIKTSVPYDEVPAYYADADLFLLPSLHDQNPLVVIEALHTGLPIALSDQAGNVIEAVTEGKNGWVLPVRDATGYKAKLREVFSATREQLSEMGMVSKTVNSRFWKTESAVRAYLDTILTGRGGA